MTVCSAGGFTAAAEELLLTQSAVSNQIRTLEEEVGTLLIERIGKSVRPTREGELLIAAGRRIFRELEDVYAEIDARRNIVTGEISIGAGGTVNTYQLPPLLTQISEEYPNLSIRILTGNTAPLIDMVLDLELDILIATGPIAHRALAQQHFMNDHYVCITPPGETNLPKRIRPQDLTDKRLILYEKSGASRDLQDEWLESAPIDPLNIHEIGSAEAQKTFVRAKFGWSLISEMAVLEDHRRGLLNIVPLSPPLVRPLVAVWRRDREDIPAIKAVRHVFQQFSERQLESERTMTE